MNIKSAVFGLISIKPLSINTIVNRLPYSKLSIYNAIENMLDNEDIIKTKINGKIKLDIPKDYNNQKKKNFYIKSLSYGVDPEILLRKNSIKIWNAIDEDDTISKISKKTGLSKKSVRKLLHLFSDYGLIYFKKKKPIVVDKDKNHPLNQILKSMLKSHDSNDIMYIPGSTPFKEIVSTPDEIENILYNKIDESFTIKKTGFMVKGNDDKKIAIIESTPKKLSIEELFIKKIFKPDGAEDYCIQLLASNKIDFNKLLELSINNRIVNPIGCYLDIINEINNDLVPNYYIDKFNNNITNKKITFLKDEKKYGKNGWEKKYEKKWNVDLYLDLGAIKHGVRAI